MALYIIMIHFDILGEILMTFTAKRVDNDFA